MDDSTGLQWASAVDLAARVRRKEVTSVELVSFFVARIGALDNTALVAGSAEGGGSSSTSAADDGQGINAVVVRCFDAAFARAQQADAATARGESWGPLHGVPMTVKESLCVEGVVTSSALERLRDYRPAQNAVAVQRLLDAGAVVLGKTNLPVNCGDLQSYNTAYGTTRNPWDPSRSPGGSSGGSAAALAAGFTPVEVGSDIAGSLRWPAHCCGVVAHKPSQGVISMHGHVPPQPFLRINGDLAVVGPMARTCRDLALLMGILAAPSPSHAAAWHLRLPPPPPRLLGPAGIRGLRCAVWSDDEACPVDPSIRAAVEGLGEALRAHGAAAVDFAARPVDFEQSYDCFLPTLLRAQNAGNSAEPFGEHWRRENTREKLRRRWAEFFATGGIDGGGFDAVLLPVSCFLALPHDQSEPAALRTVAFPAQPGAPAGVPCAAGWGRASGNSAGAAVDEGGEEEEDDADRRPYFDALMWQSLPHLVDLPVTVLPVGRCPRTALPIGVQVVAPFLHDLTAIQVGQLIENHVFSFSPPPLVHQWDARGNGRGGGPRTLPAKL